ncbi:MAG: PhzF family phenazine biosynthesis isomerase [Vicinamibacterales bacterium]|nr:PhzF family phenazine biosynthesis isomerase [Vicinamibacterales bacterium]
MTITLPVLARLTAFTRNPEGGNPAGVWLGHVLPGPAEMQRIAAEVGYSETAFLAGAGDDAYRVRYYSPEAEVSFCGHATIASGVLLGELLGTGTYRFDTVIGEVAVRVDRDDEGVRASLQSVAPQQAEPPPVLLDGVLAALGWHAKDLDRAIPPRLAWAGAWHLVLAVAERSRLQALDYDFDALKGLMLDAGLTTLQLVWRQDERTFHARNPFPVGGVVEDPATGAAAAALGGYLRDAGLITPPARFVIHQGHAMGRPSRIDVEVPVAGGVTVSGPAAWLEPPPWASADAATGDAVRAAQDHSGADPLPAGSR